MDTRQLLPIASTSPRRDCAGLIIANATTIPCLRFHRAPHPETYPRSRNLYGTSTKRARGAVVCPHLRAILANGSTLVLCRVVNGIPRRDVVGRIQGEAKFQKALKSATETDPNAKYASLYPFQGSALRHWHSVYRLSATGCVFSEGRPLNYNSSVYLAKEAQTSTGHYAAGRRACWCKSKLGPTSCITQVDYVGLTMASGDVAAAFKTRKGTIPFVKLDPAPAIRQQNKHLRVPGYQDMKREKVNSLIFEIRFPPTYPIGPPYFRIITPRFLPLMHVTGGDSICMDLLHPTAGSPATVSPSCSGRSFRMIRQLLPVNRLTDLPVDFG
ncbi:hypothetical protein DFH07DRAFT_976345 [Mycena maculata]|uniref:UBC core domain-containing protein n=1 Tax=Mycena maculata TaxID=230809 RepID=A0AAD7HHM0_9AGAR|nr:hypothetical protein DFH07DRAFT_972431 [Mycena maculata]KAJ7777504.1 hypothetical protein DFH07DRAFT_976345 [Mycena maculata]